MIIKRHKFQDNWGGGDNGGDTGGDSHDATAYGGRYADGTGFDSAYKSIAGQDLSKFSTGGGGGSYGDSIDLNAQALPSNSFQLKDAFDQANPNFVGPLSQMAPLNKSLGQLYAGYTTGSQYNVQSQDQANTASQEAGSLETPGFFHRLGIRAPGTTFAQYQASATPSQEADRIGMIGSGIGAVGQAALGTMMPPAFRLGLAGLGAYNNYQKDGNIQNAAGSVLGAMPGYFGAAGQALQGNYGNALGSVAQLNGLNGMDARALGIGLDASMGKDVRGQAMGLAGMYAGNQFGGPVGGVFGNQLGRTISRIKGYK